MAVDTRNKRASCIGFALAAFVVLPAPDGAVSAADRPHLAYSYASVVEDVEPSVPTLRPDVIVQVEVGAGVIDVPGAPGVVEVQPSVGGVSVAAEPGVVEIQAGVGVVEVQP